MRMVLFNKNLCWRRYTRFSLVLISQTFEFRNRERERERDNFDFIFNICFMMKDPLIIMTVTIFQIGVLPVTQETGLISQLLFHLLVYDYHKHIQSVFNHSVSSLSSNSTLTVPPPPTIVPHSPLPTPVFPPLQNLTPSYNPLSGSTQFSLLAVRPWKRFFPPSLWQSV
jgi:hypothetical protein